MAENKHYPVRGENGMRGSLIAPARFMDDSPERLVRLEDGAEIKVPKEALEPLSDGSFYLRGRFTSDQKLGQSETVDGAEISTATAADYGNVTRLREDCEIERVHVNRFIAEPAQIRQEGDTLVIPMMEEVWIKQLIVREEIRITRRREQISDCPASFAGGHSK